MKKIVSAMLAAAALSLPLTANTVDSANVSPELPIVHFTSEKGTDTDLYALASSLGADTDHFDILNYHIGVDFPGNDESYSHFTHTADNYEASMADRLFGDAISGGACMGISILEILAHNGVISPSDIEEGAETLHDIGLTTNSDKYITAYQAAQLHFELDFYERYFVSNYTQEQQIDRLIEMAERNMAENRYFLITIHSDLHHAVVGMGITDGKWNYNGVDYDKCVLTLDSNAKDSSSGSAKGFSEKSCIYINSETKQAYIPAYEADTEAEKQSDRLRISSIDDDTLLNYRGMINPSKEMKTDLSDMDILTLGIKYNNDYRVTITDADGTVHDLEEPVFQLSPLSRFKYFTSGSEFHIEGNTIDPDSFATKTIYLKNQRGYSILEAYDAMNITYDITKEGYRVKSNDGEKLDYYMQIWLNDEYGPCPPHYLWRFDGYTTSEVSFEPNEKGFLLSSDSLIETAVYNGYVKYDENGRRSAYASDPSFNVTAANSVLISYDDNNEIQLFIDPDNDGVYDTAVEKGDVDCSGAIDASDASYVLSAYANMSAGKKGHFLNENIADHNGDGAIDASDASLILAHYAELSAK